MSPPDFRERLRRQLELLWEHCRNFDEGNENCALDIAVRLRVLFHTTKASTSALAHLCAEHIRLVSTASEPGASSERVFIQEGGLTTLRGNRWVAALDRSTRRRLARFSDWWDSETISVYRLTSYTRKTVVLDTANKDDGAHIDGTLPTRLATLAEGPWESVSRGKARSSISANRHSNLHFQYLRQIAYEVLHSQDLLDLVAPGYQIESDAEYERRKGSETSKRFHRLNRLINTATTLFDSAQAEHARTIFDVLIDEIGETPDRSTARPYCRIKLFQASRESDECVKVQSLESLCDEIETSLRQILPVHQYMDILIKAKFELGLLYAKNGNRSKSESHWNFVRDIAKANVKRIDEEGLDTVAEPLCYYLWSLTNLAVFSVNEGAYQKVLMDLSSAHDFLEGVCAGICTTWGRARIATVCRDPFGMHIARSVFNLRRKMVHANFVLEHRDQAFTEFELLRQQFEGTGDSDIDRMLEQTRQILDGRARLPAAMVSDSEHG